MLGLMVQLVYLEIMLKKSCMEKITRNFTFLTVVAYCVFWGNSLVNEPAKLALR